MAQVKERLSKSERTRESILTVAERLFSENGFDTTSLDAIGDEAGIQGTAILYHYSTKRELYEAVLERIFTPLLEEIGAVLTAEAPLEDRLGAITSVMIRFVADRPSAAKLILRDSSSGSADAKEIMGSAAAPHWKRLFKVLRNQQEDNSGVDPLIVWNIIVGAVCFYYAAGPTVGGLPYDPSRPDKTAAFEKVMQNVTRSMFTDRD